MRVLEVAETSVRLGGRFELGLALEVQYDSEPPTGVQTTDLRLRNSLGVRF